MYLIMYKDITGICLLPRYYEGYSFNICDNLYNFYLNHPCETISGAMFDDIIRSLSIEQAVALHNALCPQFYITSIVKVDHYVYSEPEESDDEG